MSSGNKPNYHHGDLRNALIEAGLAVLAKDGMAALSLRRVARDAGVSHNAPYAHFADKEALLSGIAEQGFIGLAAEMDKAIKHTPEGSLERLKGFGNAYVRFALRNPQAFQLMFANLPLEVHIALGQKAYGTFERVLDAVVAAQAAGGVREGEPSLLAMSLWTTVHGLATLRVTGRSRSMTGDLNDEELANELLNVLFEGLRR